MFACVKLIRPSDSALEVGYTSLMGISRGKREKERNLEGKRKTRGGKREISDRRREENQHL